MYLNGEGIKAVDEQGVKIHDDHVYLIFNAHHEKIEYKLPGAEYGPEWCPIINTSDDYQQGETTFPPATSIQVDGRSVLMLTAKTANQEYEN